MDLAGAAWRKSSHGSEDDGPCIEIAPFRRRQVRPTHATGKEILPVVSHHAKKGVIGLDDPTFEFQR